MPGHQGVTPVFDGLWPGMTELFEHSALYTSAEMPCLTLNAGFER